MSEEQFAAEMEVARAWRELNAALAGRGGDVEELRQAWCDANQAANETHPE